MKRIITLIIIAAIWLMSVPAHAAGTVTINGYWIGNDQSMYAVYITWTADVSDGSVPDTAFSAIIMRDIKSLYAGQAITDPGSTAPTASYDITIVDEYGIDIYGGALADRSASSGERTYPKLTSSIYITNPIIGNLTFKLAGNSVHSATGTLVLIFGR